MSLVLLVAMMLTWGNAIPAIIRREPVPLLLGFLTAGLIKLEPGIILTIIALISLFVIIYNHLHIGLALTIFWIPFFLFPVELYKFAFPICEIILLLTVAAGTIQFIAAFGKIESIAGNRLPLKKRRFPVVAMDYLVLLLGVLGIISLLWSQQQRPAVTELRTIILEPILFYIILRSQKLTTRQLNIILMAFLFGGFLVSVIGLWQYFQGTSVITAEAGAKRLASVYGSPNNVALYIGRCTPFVIAFAFTRQPLFHRIVSTATLIIMGSAVLLTQSVGAIFIGIPLSTIVVCVLVLGKYIGRILFLSASALLLVILVSIQIPRFARAFDFSSGTNFYRLRVWESAINVIQDHPLTGLGLDQFLYAFRSEYILPDAWQEPNLSHPHNIFLDFWIRLGFCGVILLAAIEVLFWKYALRLYKKFRYQQSSTMYPIIVGAIGSMTYVISHGLVDNSVFVQDLSYVFLFLLAVIVIIQTDDNTLLSSTAMS
ncbi:MAG: O-antigen ligase family protein [Anaerolineae bacterium]